MTGDQPPTSRTVLSRPVTSLTRNTGWALAAEVVKLVTSIGAFMVVTHLLSPEEYGVFVGTLGLLWFVLPFASFGAAYLLLQRLAGEGMPIQEAVGRANGMVLWGGTGAVLVLLAVRPVVLPQSPALVLALLAFAELVFGGMHEVSVFASQARERLQLSVTLRLLQGVSRFAAAIVLLVVHPSATLTEWAWLHLTTAAVAALAGGFLLQVEGTTPLPMRRPRLREVRAGLPFSVGFGADKFRETADAWLLLRIGTVGDAGIYGAAIRLIGVAVVPLRALIASTNARFFVAGARSVAAATTVARRVTAAGAAYAVVAAVVVLVAAPGAVSLLPVEYAHTADALRMLAVWPLAVSLEAYVATAMTAIGHQRLRVLSTLGSTTVNVVLNVLLIPAHGWGGSVVASLVASVLNATVLWSALLVLAARKCGRPAGKAAAP